MTDKKTLQKAFTSIALIIVLIIVGYFCAYLTAHFRPGMGDTRLIWGFWMGYLYRYLIVKWEL